MSEVSLAHRFFEQWVRACHDQQSELLESWKENKRYTSCILEGPTSIIARIAEQLDLKSYSGGKGGGEPHFLNQFEGYFGLSPCRGSRPFSFRYLAGGMLPREACRRMSL